MSNRGRLSRSRWTDLLLLGLAWGLVGGLVEGVVRLWLQNAGATNFDLRLTGISTRLIWVAPLTYAASFAVLGLAIGVAQRLVGRLDWDRLAMVGLGTLAWVGPLASSGRIAAISVSLLALGLGTTADRLLPPGPYRRGVVRRSAVALVVLVAVLGVAVEYVGRQREARVANTLPTPAKGAPNVLLIIIDTLRADRLATYGYRKGSTPTLTRLAGEGTQFDWAVAASSWSLPSHVSMLTGRMPEAHGAEIDMYDGRFQTLPQTMLTLGYRTAAISANTLVFSTAQGLGRGFLRFDDSFYSLADGFTRTMLGRRAHKTVARVLGWTYHPVKRPAADVTARALEWARSQGDRPFFLVLNYFDVHDPEGPRSPSSTSLDPYDEAVADVDRAVGDLISGLTSRGLTDRTVIVVTADHGESLGDREENGHGTSLNVEQVHVPLIVRYPPRVPAGRRVTRAVSHTSLPATLLDLAGVAPGTFPGRSLSALWQPQAEGLAWLTPRSELRYRPWQRTLEGQDLLRSLVDLPWHYVEHSEGGPELYNLLEDPRETTNLAGREQFRPLLEQFRRAMSASDVGGS